MKLNWRLTKYKLPTFDYSKINNKAYVSRYRPRLLALYMYNTYGLESFIKTLTEYSKNKFFEILYTDFPEIGKEIEGKFQLIPNNSLDKLRVYTLTYTPNYCAICGVQTLNTNTYCSTKCVQKSLNSETDNSKKHQKQHNKNYILYTTKYQIKPENIIEFNDIYNNKQKFKIKCNRCSSIFETTGVRLNEKKYPDLCRECISIMGGERQKEHYSREYFCKECNNVFTTTPHNYKVSPFCTDKCKKDNNLKNIKIRVDENLKQTSELLGLEIISTEDNLIKYKTVKDFVDFRCTCGNIFYNSIFNIQSRLKKDKRDCICKNMTGVSNGEVEVREFINNLGISTINNKYLNGVSIDILCNNIALEYNGLYWHSDEFKDKNFHKNKTEKCLEVGVNLLHIFSNEWSNKRDIWESIIKNKLGLSKKIYARKCELREVPREKAMEFLESNHLQGALGSIMRLGLYYKGDLVSLMTFGKPRFNNKVEWELLRFCNILDYNVVGAASKLLKYFERNYKPKNLLSYANLRWSGGNLYKILGFTCIGISSPSVWYFKDGTEKIENRLKFQKHKLKRILNNYDENLTAEENIRVNNYRKIYDCGNITYIKNYI